MRESSLLKRIQIAASRAGARLFRNNVGFDAERRVHYGLCRGSSDLIGWTPIEIREEHIGSVVAVFTAVECKSKRGRLTEEQQRFLDAVRTAGGIAREERE